MPQVEIFNFFYLSFEILRFLGLAYHLFWRPLKQIFVKRKFTLLKYFIVNLLITKYSDILKVTKKYLGNKFKQRF